MPSMENRQGLYTEIPRKSLIDEVRRVAHHLSKPPTMEEFDEHSKVGKAVTCSKKFGGWKQFLIRAGLNPDATRTHIPDEELKNEFFRICELLGHTPTSQDFDKNKQKGSASTIALRFGKSSWTEACKNLGHLPPPRKLPPPIGGWNKGIDRVKIDEDKLKFMYEEEKLSASAIAEKLQCGRGTILRRLRRAGIEVKQRYYQQKQETTPESILYAELERRRIPFMPQQPIDGLYVVDALIPGAKIIIECDGDYWHNLPEMKKRDERKDKYLKSRRYHILRFTESELKADIQACVDVVEDEWDTIRPNRKERNTKRTI